MVEERLEVKQSSINGDSPSSKSKCKPMFLSTLYNSRQTLAPVNPLLKVLVEPQKQRSNTSSPMPGSKQYSRFDSPEPESGDEQEEDTVIEMHITPEMSDDDHEMDSGFFNCLLNKSSLFNS